MAEHAGVRCAVVKGVTTVLVRGSRLPARKADSDARGTELVNDCAVRRSGIRRKSACSFDGRRRRQHLSGSFVVIFAVVDRPSGKCCQMNGDVNEFENFVHLKWFDFSRFD